MAGLKPRCRTAELCTKSWTVMIFLCGPLRISAISALKRLFQRRDRRDTQRTAEKNSMSTDVLTFVQSRGLVQFVTNCISLCHNEFRNLSRIP